MRSFLVAAAALAMGACAMDGYRYHEDGYWSATARPSSTIVVYDSCFGARAYGYGPSWYPWHPCAGYAYGPYFSHGGFYALYDPFWPYSHRWPRHWHGGSHGQDGVSRERAYDEARRLGASMGDTSERTFTRYEDLGPLRRRDLGAGGGGAAGRGQAGSYGPARSPSYSSGLSGNDRGYGGAARSMGLGSSRGGSSSDMGSRSSSSSVGSSRSASSSSSPRSSAGSSRSSQSED